MEAKEKALELFDKFNKPNTTNYPYVHNAQQCALIAVDEIIMEREVIYASLGIPPGEFWKDVKREIEAL